MSIAPSYEQNYTITSEPFTENNKQYVIIKHKRTNNERKARWYPEESNAATAHKVHDCLGFGGSTDSITIFKGADSANELYLPFRESNARYHKLWGWYVPHNEAPPLIPNHLSIELKWDSVGLPDNTLKSESEIKNIITMLKGEY